MRISSFLNQNNHIDERRRAMKQQEMNKAYKKNATYTQLDKSPIFETLQKLISNEVDDEQIEQQGEILKERQEDKEISKGDLVNFTTEMEPLEMTFFPHTIPLYQTIQSTVDSKTNSHQTTTQVKNEISDVEGEVPPFANVSFDVFIPERFTNDINRKPHEEALFGKNLERTLIERTFVKATKSYNFHMQMANNGFSIQVPQYTLTA